MLGRSLRGVVVVFSSGQAAIAVLRKPRPHHPSVSTSVCSLPIPWAPQSTVFKVYTCVCVPSKSVLFYGYIFGGVPTNALTV